MLLHLKRLLCHENLILPPPGRLTPRDLPWSLSAETRCPIFLPNVPFPCTVEVSSARLAPPLRWAMAMILFVTSLLFPPTPFLLLRAPPQRQGVLVWRCSNAPKSAAVSNDGRQPGMHCTLYCGGLTHQGDRPPRRRVVRVPAAKLAYRCALRVVRHSMYYYVHGEEQKSRTSR